MDLDGVIQIFRNLPSEVYFRTGDAIHLQCIAANEMYSLYTNDKHMNQAVGHFGIASYNMIEAPN